LGGGGEEETSPKGEGKEIVSIKQCRRLGGAVLSGEGGAQHGELTRIQRGKKRFKKFPSKEGIRHRDGQISRWLPLHHPNGLPKSDVA